MDREKLLKYLIFVVMIVLIILGLLVVKLKQNEDNLQVLIDQEVVLESWPQEVPVVNSHVFDINRYASSTNFVWEYEIPTGFLYEDFIDYLHELNRAGFEAIEEMGSKNPHLLISNPTMDDDFYNIWYGRNANYKIVVSWRKFSNSSNLESAFKVTLNSISDNFDNIFKHEDEFSGEVVVIESRESENIISGE